MVRAAEQEPQRRKDNCVSGRHMRRRLMSQMEEDAALDTWVGLAVIAAELVMVRVSSAAVVEADPSSVDQGVGHRLGDLLSS